MTSKTSLRTTTIVLTCGFVMAAVSCGADANSPVTSSATGGAVAANGGSPAASTGGSTASNGGSSSATGGAVNAGGKATGGATGAGGSATGGNATGGATNAGGSATGGKATGGATNVGGSATGGKATGGAVNAGGSATGGASTSTGGASTPVGGSSSTCPSIASQTCTAGDSNCFSFFVASRARMFAAAQAFTGSTKGWGGDFKYGTGNGLTGADKLCTEIAKASMPTNCRTWKAFLSTSSINAIARVGAGPWYDRLNRLIANNVTELAATRPGGIPTTSTIYNNLPNEDGTPHHNEEPGCTDLNQCADNHDILTGSDSDGKLCTSTTCAGMGGGVGGGMGGGTTVTDFTCKDWTLGTSTSGIAPRVGHSWPTAAGMGGGTTGGGAISSDDWISQLTESGCAPGFNLIQNGGPTANGLGSVGDGGGYGAIYCLASQ